MEFTRHISRLLHDDHRETIAAMEALEEMISGRAGKTAPDLNEAKARAALEQVVAMIDSEIRDHFAFEEEELFTRLAEYGDVAIGQHLAEEHAILLPTGQALAERGRAALADGFSEGGWQQFRQTAAELIERMMTHIQKEEMGLLPLLEDVLDSETDFALTERYQEGA